jgi:GABA permease
MHADQQLSKSLKPRHLSMIAIAGVIGAGLFVGSGAAIQQAGPGLHGRRHRGHSGHADAWRDGGR